MDAQARPLAAGGIAEIRADGHHATRLLGRYELVSVIGGGGMGTVYRAHDRLLGRTVAVKVLSRGAGDDGARFEREARAAASLWHPNVVSVFDAGTDGTARFIVMEHVSGVSLAELLSRAGRLPVSQAVDIAAQIASGLAAAHRAGIVHRDVKPANVMVEESGTVKLLDFGIARACDGTTLTQAGSVFGSAPYIAPETAVGGAAEERSDVYALGCVLYEMLTGRPPFRGELGAAVLHQHVNARPSPARALAEIPPALDELVMRMLSKRASDRPPAALLGAALAASLQGEVPRTQGRGRARAAKTYGSAPRARARAHRGAAVAAAALLVTVLVAIGFALGAFGAGDAPGPGRAIAGGAPRDGTAGHARRAWRVLPALNGASVEVSHLAAAAASAALAEAPPIPATAAPPPRPAARHVKPPRGAHGKHRPAKRHAVPTPSERSEPESTRPEAEAPTAGGQGEAPSGETAPSEVPPPVSTGAPPP